MKKLLMSCGLIMLGAVHLYAAPKQIAKNGIFVTADGGYGLLFTPDNNINSGGNFDRNSFVWSAGVGYHWAMDSFNLVGIEADYFSNGQSTYNSGPGNSGSLKISSQAEALMFSYTTIWENGIDLFLKAGPVYLQQKNDVSGAPRVNGVVLTGSDNKTGFQGMVVLGVGYYIAKNLNLFVDGTYLFGHTDTNWNSISPGNTPSNISLAASAQIKAGLSYQF